MPIVNGLQKSRLFSGLSRDELDKMALIARAKKYSDGMLIFNQGDEARGIYIIVGGAAKIFQLSPEGKEHLLHTFHENDCFGEAAAFGMGIFPANAEAVDETELIFIPVKEFKDILLNNPQLSVKIIGNLSMLLHVMVEQIHSLTLKDATTRIAEYILSLVKNRTSGEKVSVELPLKKGELASQLNITQETFSRGLQRLRAQKLIKVEGKMITIEDRCALENLISVKSRMVAWAVTRPHLP
ncbi:MAG: transcriptional regulator [Deltaproteobacteria bacterium CG11_big_fil_rev_8_21_14_0_20_49_13]|nr:MAG: transcriptional regulator [Deltaproteobacteria bacterium CG11_big_fil_rev_8_21_14_0_20_49_13]